MIPRELTRQHGYRKRALKICCGAGGRRKTTSIFLKNASRHSLSPRPTTRDASHTGSTKLPCDSYGLMDLSPLFLLWGHLSQGCKGQVCMGGGCQSSHRGRRQHLPPDLSRPWQQQSGGRGRIRCRFWLWFRSRSSGRSLRAWPCSTQARGRRREEGCSRDRH